MIIAVVGGYCRPKERTSVSTSTTFALSVCRLQRFLMQYQPMSMLSISKSVLGWDTWSTIWDLTKETHTLMSLQAVLKARRHTNAASYIMLRVPAKPGGQNFRKMGSRALSYTISPDALRWNVMISCSRRGLPSSEFRKYMESFTVWVSVSSHPRSL